MRKPRTLAYMVEVTLAFLLSAAIVAGGMWGLMEMVRPREVPLAKVVNAEWMGGVRRHANGIYREGL